MESDVMKLEPLFYSKADAARILGISERMLHQLIVNKQLPVTRIGRRVLIGCDELKNFAKPATYLVR